MAFEEYDSREGAELNEGMSFGGTVELPFLCPPVWVINGDPRMRAMHKNAPALFFGGWSSNFDEMQQIGEEYGLKHFPGGFYECETTSRDNKPLKNVVSRYVYIAPFGVRKSWITREKTRYTSYVPGSRQHVQVLAYLASREKGSNGNGKKEILIPFYPVLLSAKGWQASHLEKAVSAWASKTASARAKLANGITSTTEIPASLFWSAIGTWGAEPHVETVGSGNDKSPITPVSAFIPKEVTPELLETLFVGKETVSLMLDAKRQAKTWLNAWANLTGVAAVGPAAMPIEDDYVPPEEPFNDIPF